MKSVKEIHNRWPLLKMCEICGLTIPPIGKFRSPFREDQNPSCEVYGQRIKDWSTGESFDAIDVFSMVNKISVGEAIKRLGGSGFSTVPSPKGKHRVLTVPTLRYTPEEADALSKIRGIPRCGIDFAATTVRSLGFGDVLGETCWILTDGRNIAEARRMDGQIFPAWGSLGERKSHTLAGSKKSFPIGLNPMHGAGALTKLPILLVEGGPDYLSACAVVLHSEKEMLPVAMLGSSSSIAPLALSFFKGRNVIILAHPDNAGVTASKGWANQLYQAGANPSVLQLMGGDLNDLVRRDGVEVVARGIK